MTVRFEDFHVQVQNTLKDSTTAFLHESAAVVQTSAQRNSRVDTGQLKGSWTFVVEENEATIGSGLENAIWEEFGTGEFALHGNGHKGGWKYKDHKGNWHFTRGKTPTRAFFRAYESSKPKIIARAKKIGAKMNG